MIAVKPLTLNLPDDIYESAERRAVGDGTTLSGEAVELIKRYGEGTGPGPANGHRETSRVGVDEVLQELAVIAEECRLPIGTVRGRPA